MANTVWNFNFWPQNHTGQIAFPWISRHNHITDKICHSDKEKKGENYMKREKSEEWNWSLELQRKVRVKQSEREKETCHMPTIRQISMVTSSFVVRSISFTFKTGLHTHPLCKKTMGPTQIYTQTHTHTDLVWTHTNKVTKLGVWDMDELFQTSLLMRWNNFTPLKRAEQLCPN